MCYIIIDDNVHGNRNHWPLKPDNTFLFDLFHTHPSGKDPAESVWKGKKRGKKKEREADFCLLSVTFKVDWSHFLSLWVEPLIPCQLGVQKSAILCSSFHVKMPFSCAKTAAAAALTLLSTAAAWLTVSSSSSSVIFQGSFQRSLPAFGTPIGCEC